jgi:hypothetical protein
MKGAAATHEEEMAPVFGKGAQPSGQRGAAGVTARPVDADAARTAMIGRRMSWVRVVGREGW